MKGSGVASEGTTTPRQRADLLIALTNAVCDCRIAQFNGHAAVIIDGLPGLADNYLCLIHAHKLRSFRD